MRTAVDNTPVCLAIHEFREDKKGPKALVEEEKHFWRGRPNRENRMDYSANLWET